VLRGDGNQCVALGAPLRLSADSSAFHVFDAQGLALSRLRPGNMVAADRSGGRAARAQVTAPA
jgi:multiple sugar transport system ATP-binding protein